MSQWGIRILEKVMVTAVWDTVWASQRMPSLGKFKDEKGKQQGCVFWNRDMQIYIHAHTHGMPSFPSFLGK